MPIKHEWNGTILTITSDSGTSSADLQGAKGATGARGARGLDGGSYKWELLEAGTPTGRAIEVKDENIKGIFIKTTLPITETAQNRNLNITLSDGSKYYSYVSGSTSTTSVRVNTAEFLLSPNGERSIRTLSQNENTTRKETTTGMKEYFEIGNNDGLFIEYASFNASSANYPEGSTYEVWVVR